MKNPNAYVTATVIGFVAGLRSLTGPALLSAVGSAGRFGFAPSPLKWLRSPKTALAFGALALGELVVDKLPSTPARTKAGPLVARAASGALCGAAICAIQQENIAKGAALGAAGAIAGTYAGYYVRKHAVEVHGVPALAAALTEDAIAISGGLASFGL
jgi:uncharacterized membrane protein